MPSFLERVVEGLDDPSAPASGSRALDTNFTPDASRWVLVSYTINIVCDEGETMEVKLLCDTATPPTTEQGRARLVNGATNGDAIETTHQLTALVPPGHNVRLAATAAGAGVGVASIVSQWEADIS